MIRIGAVGKLIVGDVLDVNKKSFEQSLRFIDGQLYVKWNTHKLDGHGCWELRRRADEKTAIHVADFQGMRFFTVDYIENGTNHVKDFPYLNYKILEWVKSHDLWSRFNFVKHSDKNIDEFINKTEALEFTSRDAKIEKLKADRRYEILQDKATIKKAREELATGTNPAMFVKGWK